MVRQKIKNNKKRAKFDGVEAKKALGQHFLADEDIAIEIVDSLLIPETDLKGNPTTENSVKVLEIGPGTGVLTKFLLMDKRIRLELSEIDEQSIDRLRDKFPQFLYTLAPKDFLKEDLFDFFYRDKKNINPSEEEIFIIGNFPYNISSQIFFKILDYKESVAQVVCMLQKEVAKRLASPPGGKDYGILSVFLQAWYDVEYLFDVSPTVFIPQPKVFSGVIRLWRNERKTLGCDEEMFKMVVKTCFSQRRKRIRNSIKPLINQISAKQDFNSEKTQNLITNKLEESRLLDERPERLGVEDFILLTNCFQN